MTTSGSLFDRAAARLFGPGYGADMPALFRYDWAMPMAGIGGIAVCVGIVILSIVQGWAHVLTWITIGIGIGIGIGALAVPFLVWMFIDLAENSAHRVRTRTLRWTLLVVLALVLPAGVVLWVFQVAEPGGTPPWWVYTPLLGSWLLPLWGVPEFLRLVTTWRHAGWSVDVYERGVVESRFGTVRQTTPFHGGVIHQDRALFTSPHQGAGAGRLAAPWKGELKQVPLAIRAAGQPILVREALAQLRDGHTAALPGTRDGKPGITLTPD